MTTREKIAVMEAFERGEAIERSWKDTFKWLPTTDPTAWNWHLFDYRIAPKPKVKVRKKVARTDIPCGAMLRGVGDGLQMLVVAKHKLGVRFFDGKLNTPYDCTWEQLTPQPFGDDGAESSGFEFSTDAGKTWVLCWNEVLE